MNVKLTHQRIQAHQMDNGDRLRWVLTGLATVLSLASGLALPDPWNGVAAALLALLAALGIVPPDHLEDDTDPEVPYATTGAYPTPDAHWGSAADAPWPETPRNREEDMDHAIQMGEQEALERPSLFTPGVVTHHDVPPNPEVIPNEPPRRTS